MNICQRTVLLETKKVVILAPKNPQPENSSIFSPDGKNVLFAVADEQKIECNTNRDGTWCSVKSYDLYLYNMESGTKTQLNSDTFPINLSGDAYNPSLFGWVDENNVYYSCSDNSGGYAYCFLNINNEKFQQKSYMVGNEQSVLSNIYRDRGKKAELTHGPEDSSSFDKTASIFGECTLFGYDGCEMVTIWVKDGSKKIFLANKADLGMFPNFYWAFNNHIYSINSNFIRGVTNPSMVKIY